MTSLSRDDVRLLFMREGKIAAAVWPWLEEEPPVLVRAHLLALIEAAGPSYSNLVEDDRDALLATFLAAARKARTPGRAEADGPLGSAPEAVQARFSATLETAELSSAAREAAWGAPSTAALAVVESISTDPGAGVSDEDAAEVYRDIGRLTAPLWITGKWDDVPPITLAASAALDGAMHAVLRPSRRFDESRSEFHTPSVDDALSGLNRILLDSLAASQRIYFTDHPVGGRLPSDPGERHTEAHRRAEQRAKETQRAAAAVDLIVEPILDSVVQYAHAQADLAAQREKRELDAQIAARALYGYERPEPQRYGVSPRGAELWVTDALRWLGEHDAYATRQSADGGMDIVSSRLAVSVKHYAGAVPVEEVREIFGVATVSKLNAVLWTSGTLTESARQFADVAPVAVVNYNVETASWSGLNAAGHALLAAFETQEHSVPGTGE